eukprot:TRINITY_DN8354_c0_g1_i1.p1 TRINITY_DN8354_c0_g1~~TRINITY_DN8354_c0_g1_i1.p1  ORF type:complete len:161 (-),score=16.60 TRINITY_DN8354_c0_g1_i1:163-645(-)
MYVRNNYPSHKSTKYLGFILDFWDTVQYDDSDELLYGKIGYLLALRFIKKEIHGVIPDEFYQNVIATIVYRGLSNGSSKAPMNYYWHGKDYWGACHGLTGILFVLLEEPFVLKNESWMASIKGTIEMLMEEFDKEGDFNLDQTALLCVSGAMVRLVCVIS